MALGAAFRLWHLGTKSLWQDEPATVALARMPWPQFIHVWWTGEASFQVFYFLLMRAWLHLGNSEAWIRLPAALFGIASLPLMYLLARKLVGHRAAIASAAMLALSPAHVYYSQNARSYTMTIFLVMLSSWFFVQAVERDRERDWLLWTLFSGLAVYAHYFASLVLVAQAGSLFLSKKPAPWRRMVLHTLVIAVLALPNMSFLFRTDTEFLKTALNVSPTPKQVLHLLGFLGGSSGQMLLALILWVAGVNAIRHDRLGRDQPEIFWRGMLVILWAALPVLLIGLISLEYPVFVQRYMIFSLPAAILLAGCGVSALPRRNLGVWLAAVLCASCAVTILLGYRKPREDWRGVTNAILMSAAPGDALLIYPFYARPGFDYYYDLHRQNAPALRLFTRPFYGFGEGDQDLVRALDSSSRPFRHVWVVLRRASHGHDYQAENSAILATLQADFGKPVTRQFQDLTLLEYGA